LILHLCQQGQLPPYDIVVLNLPHFVSKATTGSFLEFDTNMLFGNTTPTLASPACRHVRSNDRTNCARFVEATFQYRKEHNWFRRMSTIKQTSQLDHKNAESLDRDWLRLSLYAENQCSSRPTPPYSTILAQSRNRRSALRKITAPSSEMKT
jgi:hypothetical protein